MLQCESLVYKLSGLHFIISLILLYLPSLNAACTTPTPYDLDGTCYAVCPWVAPNQYYGDINSGLCVTTCTSPYYAFDTNKTCIATCPSASIQTYYDDVNRRCVYTCPANYFGYTNQSCLASKYINNQRLSVWNIFGFYNFTLCDYLPYWNLLYEWYKT